MLFIRTALAKGQGCLQERSTESSRSHPQAIFENLHDRLQQSIIWFGIKEEPDNDPTSARVTVLLENLPYKSKIFAPTKCPNERTFSFGQRELAVMHSPRLLVGGWRKREGNV